MNKFEFIIWALLIGLLPCSMSLAQNSLVEICDNAVDDDADGLIDLNDTDCNCPVLSPTSLLPNSSFEELDCCPTGHSTVACAGPWTQASEATPDLFNPCGYPADDLFDVPQPVPSGDGFIGIIDGIFTGSTRPNIKEYIGTCLDKSLEADTIYRLQFYAGFLDERSSPPIEITMFGSSDCNAFPFGIGDLDFGCPSNDTNWTNIGSISASGLNEWRQLTMLITSNKDINAVIIGPGCELRSHSNNTYYFLDDLLLTKRDETSEEVKIGPIGEPCAASFRLELPFKENRAYQWYRDGIAILDATENTIAYLLEQGVYHVRVIDEDGSCYTTSPYSLKAPDKYTQIVDTFCEGDFYNFGSSLLENEGIYYNTLQSSDLCDSIVELKLSMIPEFSSNQSIKILEESSYNIASNSYDTPGDYQIILPSSQGCDSTINITLSFYDFYIPNIFSPNNDGSNDNFTITTDADLIAIDNMNIYDRWGIQVYKQSNSASNDTKGWNGDRNGKPVNAGVYTYVMQVTMIDGSQTILSGMITLIR